MTEPDDTLAREARRRLASLPDPSGGGDIVATGRVEAVQQRGTLLQVSLRTGRADRAAAERVSREAEALLRTIPGVSNATVILTAHREAAPAPAATPRAPGPSAANSVPRSKLLADVPHVIAVASGKGGVGKSTVAVNLACALARLGKRVGLLDADIHGPSVPRMLGLDGSGQPEVRGDRMQPLGAFGLAVMSMGFLVPERQAMIWRGPMVMGALEQLMGQVDWPALDIMVIDMPPGTGDAQLTIAQRVSLAGVVIVSTPQDIALIDARRGIDMFSRTDVPVLGIVENMSVFCCPNCGTRTPIFGEGGARTEASRLGVPFLGSVPLELGVREAGDRGAPVAVSAPESAAGTVFAAIARTVVAGLGVAKPGGPVPSRERTGAAVASP